MEGLKACYECLCSSKAKYPDPYNFEFSASKPILENSIHFESNFVKTSKYTWYNFLPKSLLFQFRRLANIYFLIVAILQTIKIISPLNPITAWIPLIVVLSISMIRQGYEDFQRYKSDKELNHETITKVRRNGSFVEVVWSEVVVGEICKVEQDELFPADMILLNSSIENGVAFIETASLDGEKNLKPRNAFKTTVGLAQEDNLSNFEGSWKGIVPDKELHKFNSMMKINGETIVFEGDKQLLYRGSRLKNTKWVYGLVIYTGRNTKIMMNSESSAVKMSQVELKVNKVLVIILLFQLLLCFILGILYGVTRRRLQNMPIDYFEWADYTVAADSILIFFTYFVLFNTMIPISLIVSIEIVKVSQSYFINKDKMMYSEFRKKMVSVKTASLNEELGQIEYVFSDKTGTLTMNLMEFKIAVIGSKMYGDLGLIMNDPDRPPQAEKGFRDDGLTKLIASGAGDERLSQPITVKGGPTITFSSQKELAEEYLLCLATAHEVMAEKDKTGKMKYQGPSPDEITLVDAAKDMQFEFLRSTQSSTVVNVKGTEKTFELLEVFPFTSDRKRMSVILKVGNTIKMFSKGADSIIKARLASDQILNLDAELTKFSRIGLRTLLIAMRTISESEYSSFKKSVEQLPKENRQAAMDKLTSSLEQGLYLLGATAVLDRLQDFVPETIRDLIRANIKVWMLTGDKMETAENIAKSCNLIQSHFEILRYEAKNAADILPSLKRLVTKADNLTENHQPKAFLIEGSDLTPILESQEGKTELANLAKNCEAVVCCRLLPLQKAQVVEVVRTKLNKITLSIGDGANDVPMIKTAHIGIGLFGEEGMGAVQASDYALPEFRMLWRLLLVHGRWNYIRISEMILYFFYKNMLFTVPQLVFAFYCAFSGQSLFDDWYISFYNLFFTSLPLVIRAILEQDVNYVFKKTERITPESTMTELKKARTKDPVLERQAQYLPESFGVNKFFFRLFPKIYFIGQENCIFNYTNYFLWVVEAFVEGILITIFCMYIIGSVSINGMGYSSDVWLVGVTTFSCVILVVTFKLATHTKFWSGFLFISVTFLSVAIYVAYMWISNFSFSEYIKGTVYIAWTTGETYLTVLFCCCLILFVDGIVVHVDFLRGGYSSKMREVVQRDKEESRTYMEMMSLKITEGITQNNMSEKND